MRKRKVKADRRRKRIRRMKNAEKAERRHRERMILAQMRWESEVAVRNEKACPWPPGGPKPSRLRESCRRTHEIFEEWREKERNVSRRRLPEQEPGEEKPLVPQTPSPTLT